MKPPERSEWRERQPGTTKQILAVCARIGIDPPNLDVMLPTFPVGKKGTTRRADSIERWAIETAATEVAERAVARLMATTEARVALRARNRRKRRSRVYIVRAVKLGLYKFGTARNVRKRLSGLQCGSPDRLELVADFEGDVDVEHRIHARFASASSHGEWFFPTPEVTAWVERIARRVAGRSAG